VEEEHRDLANGIRHTHTQTETAVIHSASNTLPRPEWLSCALSHNESSLPA